MNEPTWYNATHYYANSSRNSLRLKNRRCELTLRAKDGCGGNLLIRLNNYQKQPLKSFVLQKLTFV